MHKYPKLEVLAQLDVVEAYCDGSFFLKSGVGGWGVRVVGRNKGAENRVLADVAEPVVAAGSPSEMEARAIVGALELLRPCRGRVVVHSDYRYLVDVLDVWSWGGVDERGRKFIESHLLLHRALRDWSGRKIAWRWVRSRGGNPHHRAAHNLAKTAARECAVRWSGKPRRGLSPVVVTFGS